MTCFYLQNGKKDLRQPAIIKPFKKVNLKKTLMKKIFIKSDLLKQN